MDKACSGLTTLHEFYASNIHGYASLTLCVTGCLGNVLNMIVLTRENMISPINTILTALAISDLAVLLDYIPYTWHRYLRPRSHSMKDCHTYGWAMLVLWHSNFFVLGHTVSVWLTVLSALWRYLAIAFPLQNRVWCSMKITYIAVIAVCFLSILLCIPSYLSFDIIPVVELLDNLGFPTNNNSIGINTTLYEVNIIEIVKPTEPVDRLGLVVYGLLMKLLPSFIITVLSLRLIHAMLKAKKNHQKLSSASNTKNANNGEGEEKQMDRTTYILLTVVILLLITEVPEGVLAVSSGILGEFFLKYCYQTLFEMLDLTILTISTINFFIYFLMSKTFRDVFKSLFNCLHFKSQKSSQNKNTILQSPSTSNTSMATVSIEFE